MMSDLLTWQHAQWQQLQQNLSTNRVPHALLLTGPEGIGKGRFARLLANALTCKESQDSGLPCGQCKNCHLVQEYSHPDVRLIEPEEEGKQIKIEVIREMASQSTLSVPETRFRIFIIEPADAMNPAAANALLKTLEEPVPGTLLLLVSSSPDRLPATIKSRCQTVRFELPPVALANQWLAGELAVEPAHAELLLQVSGGAPMIALDIYRQDNLQPYLEALEDFLSLIPGDNDPVGIAEKWYKVGKPKLYLHYLTAWLHDLIRLHSGGSIPRVIPETHARGLKTATNQLDLKQLYAALDLVYEIRLRVMNNLNMHLALERFLLYWVQINNNGTN